MQIGFPIKWGNAVTGCENVQYIQAVISLLVEGPSGQPGGRP